ncbi:MAG: menaquinone biosynthesis protein [Thermodesulfobacteriota bacterium]
MAAAVTARIGMVNFINTAPFYSVWSESVHRPDWRITEAAPSHLNRLLHAGELDLGIVSSHEYAAHPAAYLVMPDLSISATGAVGSVCLFSQEPVEKLDGRLINLSPQSQTSNQLVKIILEDFCGISPRYAADSADDTAAALLAIGDEALRLSGRRAYRYEMDLGAQWQRHTGLPFVFAVWAVRRDFYENNRETIREIHDTLDLCIHEGAGRLAGICQTVAPRIPMDEKACFRYLKGLEYDLGPDKIRSLEYFYRKLIERGEADAGALPVAFCSC